MPTGYPGSKGRSAASSRSPAVVRGLADPGQSKGPWSKLERSGATWRAAVGDFIRGLQMGSEERLASLHAVDCAVLLSSGEGHPSDRTPLERPEKRRWRTLGE